MVPERIGSLVLASEIVQCPLTNLIWHLALSNLETERRETFDEGIYIVFVKAIQLTVPLCPVGLIQKVAVPCPEDVIDLSPKLVVLFVSSLSKKAGKADSIGIPIQDYLLVNRNSNPLVLLVGVPIPILLDIGLVSTRRPRPIEG